jgi:hypothetical protein
MRKVTVAQLAGVREAIARYPKPRLPAGDYWRTASDADVWLRVVSQVVVVGGARPAARLSHEDIRRRLSWRTLSRNSDAQAAKAIWGVLRDIGARYAGKSSDGCRKTAALVRNLRALSRHTGGPKGFISKVAAQPGSTEKINYVTAHLSYVKNKGARDFLTSGFGLVTDRIALDSRVLGALYDLGIDVPKVAPTDTQQYAALEAQLLRQICAPLNLTGAELDQILFLNYEEIKRSFKAACK